MRFSQASVEQRLAALTDPNSTRSSRACDGVWLAEGSISGRRVRLVVTDRLHAGGSLGVDQCAALTDTCERSVADGAALVFALDSAGARLDEGLAALGAFRRFYRSALTARLAGVPMIAVLAKNCFGGASMLAALCAARSASAESRYGMSGPGIVEGLGGRGELDASDSAAVCALYGGRSRCELGVIDRMCADDAAEFRQAVEVLLAQARTEAPDLHVAHQRLKARLARAGLNVSRSTKDIERAFRSRRPVGALDCWWLADALLTQTQRRSLAIELDCPGQAPTRLDEGLLISEYVAHLALCVASLSARGCDVRLRITGEASGGIYVALAAAARVEATPNAMVRVLPRQAVAHVIGEVLPDAGLDQALATGVVDAVEAP